MYMYIQSTSSAVSVSGAVLAAGRLHIDNVAMAAQLKEEGKIELGIYMYIHIHVHTYIITCMSIY